MLTAPPINYRSLVERVRALLRAATPPGATVLVVSRGDGMLIDVPGWDVRHFPQSPTGLYAGHYPADGEAAVAHLKELQGLGARYLMIPATGLWWLDHYDDLADWLASAARVVVDEAGTGRLFDLVPAYDGTGGRVHPSRVGPQVSGLLRSLLPPGAGVALIGSDAQSVEVDDRPAWFLEPPRADTATSVEDVLNAISGTRASGGQYVALLIPEDRSAAPDGALRRELRRRCRRVCAQRLVEVFAVAHDADA